MLNCRAEIETDDMLAHDNQTTMLDTMWKACARGLCRIGSDAPEACWTSAHDGHLHIMVDNDENNCVFSLRAELSAMASENSLERDAYSNNDIMIF